MTDPTTAASAPPPLDLAGSRTRANLTAAFTAASAASCRYLWFAQQADVDGRPNTANHFRSMANDATSNALGLLEFLADVGDPVTGRSIGDTDDNLDAALAAESLQRDETHPDFAEVARAEGFADIADWFETLAGAAARRATKLSVEQRDG
jgi:rubrerythrin